MELTVFSDTKVLLILVLLLNMTFIATLGEMSPSKDQSVVCTQSTASDESVVNGAFSDNNIIVDHLTSPLRKKVMLRLLIIRHA